jgi:hypothetical protein
LAQLLLQYTYLQLLDFLTTLAFLMHGVREGNPLVRWLLETSSSPVAMLGAVKLLAVTLGLAAFALKRQRLLARMNMLFAALVAWNLVAIIAAASRA